MSELSPEMQYLLKEKYGDKGDAEGVHIIIKDIKMDRKYRAFVIARRLQYCLRSTDQL